MKLIQTKDEALQIIEQFIKAGGIMFLDCLDQLSESDIIKIAKYIQKLQEPKPSITDKITSFQDIGVGV